MHLLIVEDERKMADLLKRGLEEENHRVTLAQDGRIALELAKSYDFDVIVLDVMLPGLDGFTVAQRLRRVHNNIPILMLTARDAVPDITKGLDSGADDYLTKPFAFAELLARIRALTRRTPAKISAILQVGDLNLNPETRQVTRGNREIALTATEYRLLEFMMRRAGRVLSRSAIVEGVWGLDGDIEENTLDAFVSLLRNKIDKGFKHKLIHTVRGFGYAVREGSHR
jgi:DNA-binding response OmpR family regulator